MKFKKDGKVFEDIMKERRYHCTITADCGKCFPIGASCSEECRNNPRKSAQFMGFEVIEEEDDKMELPLDIGSMTLAQAKEYCKNHCSSNNKKGEDSCQNGCELANRNICSFGDSLDVFQWNLDRQRLTPDELDICRALGAKWLTVGSTPSFGVTYVTLWTKEPSDGMIKRGEYRKCRIGELDIDKFPSLKPGDCISVEDLL